MSIACFHSVVHPSIQWKHPLTDESAHLELQQFMLMYLSYTVCHVFTFPSRNCIFLLLSSQAIEIDKQPFIKWRETRRVWIFIITINIVIIFSNFLLSGGAVVQGVDIANQKIIPIPYTTNPDHLGVAFRGLGIPDRFAYAIDLSFRFFQVSQEISVLL